MKPTNRYAVVLVLIASLSWSTAASADPEDRSLGVRHARAIGIRVSNAAAAIMGRAPRGSCLNDPTQERCPPASAVVAAHTTQMADGSVGYAVGPSASTITRTMPHVTLRRRARTATVDQCYIRAGYPYYSSGSMWGDGAQDCLASVSYQELYVELDRVKLADGTWAQLGERFASGAGGETLRRTAGYNCGHADSRHYRTVSTGYALLEGVYYSASQSKDDWRTCPA